LITEATKACTGPLCQGSERPLSDFNCRARRSDGLQFWCRRCGVEWARNPESKAAKKKSREAWKDRNPAAALLQECKSRAKTKGLEFGLTIEWVQQKLLAGGCEGTGVAFVLGVRRHPFMPSIDRIDSSKPYTTDNCRIVLWIINAAKNDLAEDDFQSALRQVAEAVVERI